jgi:hypothetical protein
MHSITPSRSALDQRLAVVLGAQRRVHLEAACRACGRPRRSASGGAGDASPLTRPGGSRRRRAPRTDSTQRGAGSARGRPRTGDRASRATIVDSEIEGSRPGRARRDRALVHHAVARQRRVLLVQGDHAAAQPLVLERLAQHPGRGDRLAVVGEAERAGVAQRAISVSSLARRPTVIAARKPTRTRACSRRRVDQRAQHRSDRRHGGGVRHRDHLRRSRRRRRRGAGLEVLLVLLARGAQVDVRVDERREQVLAGCVDRLARPAPRASPARRARRSRRRGSARRGAVDPVRGSSTWAADQQLGGGRRPGLTNRTASGGSCDRLPASASRPAARRGPPSARRRPALTCSPISACGESIASAESSTPRLTGPGCISSWRGRSRSRVDLVARRVLAQRRHERLVHPLVLHPQHVDDVGLAEVSSVGWRLAAERLDLAREQRRRTGDRDLGAHPLEGEDVRARDARVQDVADDPDVEAVELPSRSRSVKTSSSAWVGCSCLPSPALITAASVQPATRPARRRAASGSRSRPGRRRTASGRVAQRLALVDARAGERMLTTSAESRLAASSKLELVRVEAS